MSINKSKLFSIIFSIVMVISTVAVMIPAVVSAEADKTLTLICRKDDITLTGMEWELYKVGERRNDELVLTGAFASYPVDLHDMSADNISAAAKTLEAYAAADQISAFAEGKTDEKGELKFNGLESGLYLASGEILLVGSVYYVPSALLIEVGENGGSLNYDAYPKFYYDSANLDSKTYTVKKVWVGDDENKQARPVSVTVDIYKDNALYDTVILDESNNWEYKWKDLDSAAAWNAVERDIPANYKVSIENNMTQYLIKNSYEKTVEEVTTTTTLQTTTTSGETKLPQTGQLWWPVPVLGASGLLMIGIGLRLGKKDRK